MRINGNVRLLQSDILHGEEKPEARLAYASKHQAGGTVFSSKSLRLLPKFRRLKYFSSRPRS